jgi:hypothetical protein
MKISNVMRGSALSVIVPTYDFSAVFLCYLYRVVSATIVGNNDLVYPCQ